MSYNTIVAMAESQSLIARVAACAAEQGNSNPRGWTGTNMLALVAGAGPGLQATWEASVDDENANPDTGRRTDVVTDAMILSAVQARKATQGVADGWPA